MMATPRWSRRRVLSTVAASSTLAVAGCIGSGQGYEFDTNHLGSDLATVSESFHRDDLTEISANRWIDYSSEYKRSVFETLLDEGSVIVPELPLAIGGRFGTTTRSRPRFITVDGVYHQVVLVDRTETTETQWVFYMDLTEEEPPSSATVVYSPPESLSDLDTMVVRGALESTAAARNDPLDASGSEFPHRGVRFHHRMDPQASDLIPSPPFDYYGVDGNYFAAKTAEGEVEVAQYEVAVREVGPSLTDLERFFEREFVDARFDRDSLPSSAVDVLDVATDPAEANEYTESPPMSEGLEFVTERLGMQEHMPEEGEDVVFRNSIFHYDGEWHDSDLTQWGSR